MTYLQKILVQAYLSPYTKMAKKFLPPSVDFGDLDDAVNDDEFIVDRKDWLAAIKGAKVVSVEPKDLASYDLHGHGYSFTKHPPHHGKRDVSSMGPAIVFNCGGSHFILDGQHRVAQAVEEQKVFSVYVITLPPKYLPMLKSRRPSKQVLKTSSKDRR